MKKNIKTIIFGKCNKLSFLLVLALFGLVGLGCFIGGKSTETDDKKSTAEKKSDDKKSTSNESEDNKVNDKSEESVEKSDASKGEAPSDEEVQQMAREVVKDFNDAIQQEDFADFRLKTAKPFQKQYSAGDMNSSFNGFISRKTEFGKVFDSITDDNMDAEFTDGPKIEKEGGYKMLKVKGTYSTFPKTKVDFNFMPEGKDWKLIRLEFKVGID